ncbi:TetR family transcriptional regulator [Streptomyces sp. NPDC006645]|uniref:TetR/AcrR family transcriptional regulator n=1 Tax=unclassified Streptomyces TaxID=2593676 RepID=UPI00339FDC0B
MSTAPPASPQPSPSGPLSTSLSSPPGLSSGSSSGLPSSSPSGPSSSLRERKKRRTRQLLVDTSLELFTERGFDKVTLDELCDSVEISKRTFFRYFTSKEDVAMAPTQDLWLTFLDVLETADLGPADRPVLALIQDTLLTALDRTATDEWSHRVLLSRNLTERTPSMDAHGLHFCDRTTRAALAVLYRRLDIPDPADPRARLAADMVVAAFHCALATWASAAEKTADKTADRAPGTAPGTAADNTPGTAPRTDPSSEPLSAHTRRAFTALAEAATFPVTPRQDTTPQP